MPARLARSVPLDKAMDDAMVAYSQNGEAVRPEQGYPLRLILPGWEGNINVKWLHRLELIDQPAMTRDEAAFYTDLLPSGKARQFGVMMEAKSIVTRPSGGQHLPAPGFYEITGIAWSGRAHGHGRRGFHRRRKDLAESAAAAARAEDIRWCASGMPWNWDGNPKPRSDRAASTNRATCSRQAKSSSRSAASPHIITTTESSGGSCSPSGELSYA